MTSLGVYWLLRFYYMVIYGKCSIVFIWKGCNRILLLLKYVNSQYLWNIRSTLNNKTPHCHIYHHWLVQYQYSVLYNHVFSKVSGFGLPYFFGYRTKFFSLPKQSQKSRSILWDGSRSLRLFRKGKTRITAKLHWIDLVICTHSEEGNPVLHLNKYGS